MIKDKTRQDKTRQDTSVFCAPPSPFLLGFRRWPLFADYRKTTQECMRTLREDVLYCPVLFLLYWGLLRRCIIISRLTDDCLFHCCCTFWCDYYIYTHTLHPKYRLRYAYADAPCETNTECNCPERLASKDQCRVGLVGGVCEADTVQEPRVGCRRSGKCTGNLLVLPLCCTHNHGLKTRGV